jgi:hypothetical protein
MLGRLCQRLALPDLIPVGPGRLAPVHRMSPASEEVAVAKHRREEDDDRGDESRAGRDKDGRLARLSTVNLVIQMVALIRVIIDYLGH